jgi:hypothetical protein
MSPPTTPVAIAALAVLAGCAESSEPARSVSYYQEHPEERQAMVQRCADDPGSLGAQPNCVNAKRATAIEDIGSFKDLPPMELTPKSDAPTAPGER